MILKTFFIFPFNPLTKLITLKSQPDQFLDDFIKISKVIPALNHETSFSFTPETISKTNESPVLAYLFTIIFICFGLFFLFVYISSLISVTRKLIWKENLDSMSELLKKNEIQRYLDKELENSERLLNTMVNKDIYISDLNDTVNMLMMNLARRDNNIMDLNKSLEQYEISLEKLQQRAKILEATINFFESQHGV